MGALGRLSGMEIGDHSLYCPWSRRIRVRELEINSAKTLCISQRLI